MLGLGLFGLATPVLHGDRVVLRLPRQSDYGEWAALRSESADFLKPWEPRWADDELERASWRRRVRRYRREHHQGAATSFLIFEREGGRMVGGITIGNIRYGVSQSAQIGYWTGAPYAGKGYMQDAMRAVLRHAFQTMRLHRIEAACIPGNERSQRVLEKAGFRQEGYLHSYLRINGAWQDHILYGLVADDLRTQKDRG